MTRALLLSLALLAVAGCRCGRLAVTPEGCDCDTFSVGAFEWARDCQKPCEPLGTRVHLTSADEAALRDSAKETK